MPLSPDGGPGSDRETVLARALAVLEHLPHVAAVVDRDGTMVWQNDAARRVLGAAADEVHAMTQLLTLGSVQRYFDEARPVLLTHGSWTGRLDMHTPDGPVPVDATLVGQPDGDGSVEWMSLVLIDVSDYEHRAAVLAHRASHDPLTGLPNRALLIDRLDMALAVARRSDSPVGVVALDLDRFKEINDALGHAAGDELLAKVTARIQSATRASDTVARLGGDEFVVVMHPTGEGEVNARRLASRVRARIASPAYHLRDGSVETSASVGLAIAPGGRIEREALLRAADAALYEAKRRGGNQVVAAESVGAGDAPAELAVMPLPGS